MSSDREPTDVTVGDHVIYVDPEGNERDALAIRVPDTETPTINLVFVSPDPNRTDGRGRQTEKPTSVSHERRTDVHGRYWRFPE